MMREQEMRFSLQFFLKQACYISNVREQKRGIHAFTLLLLVPHHTMYGEL